MTLTPFETSLSIAEETERPKKKKVENPNLIAIIIGKKPAPYHPLVSSTSALAFTCP
jgi:hypothetical protein